MNFFFLFASALILSMILTPLLIPALKRLKFGQSIREIGPSWHQKKSGTPTMGGISFILAASASVLIFGELADPKMLFVAVSALLFGIIGFLDDFIKVVLKRNLGLKAYQKFGLQLVVSVALGVYGAYSGLLTTEIVVPFTSLTLDLGVLYIPFIIFVNLAMVNSVNLTDGLDGLATSVTIGVVLYFAAERLLFGTGTDFSFALIGALTGFLLFNAYPAKVFMGDTGSLYLGGAVAAMAMVSKNPLILIVVGIIYLIEALSVIIQVTYFKHTGKRVFKMSPIHHHFEMSGWSEVKIVTVFTVITILLAVFALFLG